MNSKIIALPIATNYETVETEPGHTELTPAEVDRIRNIFSSQPPVEGRDFHEMPSEFSPETTGTDQNQPESTNFDESESSEISPELQDDGRVVPAIRYSESPDLRLEQDVRLVAFEQGTPEWHLWRQNGLGQDDIATIIEEGQGDTVLAVYRRKSAPSVPQIGTFWPDFEFSLAETLANRSEWTLEVVGPSFEGAKPWMQADAHAVVSQGTRNAAVLCFAVSDRTEWYNEDTSERVPFEYMVRAAWIMKVSGLRTVILSFAIPGPNGTEWDMREIEYNDAADEFIGDRAEQFWNLVQMQREPDPTLQNPHLDRCILAEMYSDLQLGVNELPEDIATMLRDRKRLAEIRDHHQANLDQCENALKILIGCAPVATINGKKVASSRVVETIEIDKRKLATQYPEVFDACATSRQTREWSF